MGMIDMNLQHQIVSPDLVIIGFFDLPPTMEAILKTYSRQNKTVVVTGGAEGIGFEIAEQFLKNGAKRVFILDINETLGQEATRKLNETYGDKVSFYKCDVTKDLETISKLILDKYTVDVLVNNAGVLDELNIRKTIDINVTAVVEWSYKFWEHMRNDKGGKGGTILNVDSIYGYRTDPFIPVYNCSKFAVFGFTKALGYEYNFKRFGVRVIAICPSYTKTPLARNLVHLADPVSTVDFQNLLARSLWQKAADVGKAAMDVFENAESGEAWEIEGAQPVKKVTQQVA